MDGQDPSILLRGDRVDFEISFAKAEDKARLKALFLNSFDDTIGFVNMFFDHNFNPENIVCVTTGEEIIGQAHLLPCAIGGEDCFYAYGICVDKKHRKEGVGLALMEFIKAHAKSKGHGVLLHPADEHLFSFYEKAGFYPCGYYCEKTLCASGEAVPLLPVTAEKYKAVRDGAFCDKTPLVWDEKAVEYALLQEAFFGLEAFSAECDGRKDILLCGKDSGGAFIKETTAKKGALQKIVSAVAKRYSTERVRVTLPRESSSNALVCGYGFNVPKDIYMNLLLD